MKKLTYLLRLCVFFGLISSFWAFFVDPSDENRQENFGPPNRIILQDFYSIWNKYSKSYIYKQKKLILLSENERPKYIVSTEKLEKNYLSKPRGQLHNCYSRAIHYTNYTNRNPKETT